ncbi:signal peptide peptidase [Nesidiocoris tenuis]|uniref:Signal peptide peptidase n=1 Tax=Nesidiocoris tenuis TaxID=355587 RepID=A0ABN7AF66_9HEMI|nr:signal peptide peptidase [Nesidiocoris tenuis]
MSSGDVVGASVDGMNSTEAGNENVKIPATAEGMAIAYASLIIMALFPIFLGSVRSVKHHKEQKQQHKETGEKPDTLSLKDAAMFPFVASLALFALYIFFKIFSKDQINLLLTGYFFVLGVLALCRLASPIISSLVPATIPNIPFNLIFLYNTDDCLIDYEFTSYDIVCLLCCSLFGIWYVFEKHWLVNNLFGIAFSISGVEMFHLNNVVTGCILLCGLFVYDIFWVFGTNVMVTVAKSFEAPIKLVFPQDLLEHGLSGKNFAMLGLGDIVIPGIFIALLLRFDNSRKKNSKLYFYTTFIAYLAGLILTIFVMHMFKHAQPALLYLVPSCLGTPLLLALIRGDIGAMFKYEDHPSEEEKKKPTNKSPKNKAKKAK